MSTPAPERFPEGFLWGAATAAYQIEGSPLADGAGPSIWHRFSHTPGRTLNGDTGDTACDHYHRYPEDVEWMRRLGLNAYRFSLSWSRLLPEGRGRVNPAGVAFYDRLIDRLLEHGIRPMVTLYHWDLPAALDDRGGWLNPEIVRWFADYAQVAFRAYGDRVPMWATLNEPWVVADGGYLFGVNAPGHRNLFEAPLASHHMLCAHGAAVEAFRAIGGGRIGIVVNLEPKVPASDSEDDVAAAARDDAYLNRQYLDPIFLGSYPAAMHEIFGEAWPEFPEREMEQIRQPIDFLGVNYYKRGVIRYDPALPPVCARGIQVPGSVYTETGWEVSPAGLTDCLCQVKDRYGDFPIYITENGAAFADPEELPESTEVLEDPQRVSYLREHLRAAREAIRKGVDLRGYFVWSLLDNFEWSGGYSKRFGIIHVNYATQKRTAKRSGLVYRDEIASRGEEP